MTGSDARTLSRVREDVGNRSCATSWSSRTSTSCAIWPSRFANRGEPLDDLIQVGTLGLIKAIDRFDVERGLEFTTYATPTVIGEIKRYFRDKGWAIRVPRRLQELNLAVNRAHRERCRSSSAARRDGGRTRRSGRRASEEEIIEAQELGQAYNLLSLDAELAGRRRGKGRDAAGLSRRRTDSALRSARGQGESCAGVQRARPPRAHHRSTCATTKASSQAGDRKAPAACRRCTSRACSSAHSPRSRA